ncbi:hypothetical protein [Rhodococcus sp. MTM3W5.2]|uniref:hypothetical protein n=1 Tax=Rhodococcus sp. MTM3W5.2 TaxID=1805827 RepID=UPI00097C97CB|nr:hypothetical protein [Rhodococcus sp. MTM3W5.2]
MTITPALLYRLSGGAVIVAFALNLTGGLLHPVVGGNSHSVESLTSGTSPWAQMILLVGTIIQLIALPGVYAWFAGRAGVAGLVGFVTLYSSLMLASLTHLTIEAFASYTLASNPDTAYLVPADGSLLDSTAFVVMQTASGLTYLVSLLAFGIILVWTRAVPLWIGVIMTIGGVIGVIPWPEVPGITGLVIELPRGLAFAAIGLVILRAHGRPQVTETPSAPARATAPTPA